MISNKLPSLPFKNALAALALAAPLFCAQTSTADEINNKGLITKNITIEKVDGDKLIYKTQAGAPGEKAITDALRLTITDEPNLVPAEDAFAAGKWADAVDGYQKVLRSSPKAWLKDYSAVRLLKAGEKSDRFDAVVAAYIHLLGKDPVAAKDLKINFPADPANAYLKTAASQVDTAYNAEKDPAKQMSLDVFRMNIAKAMKDEATTLKIAERLSRSSGSGGSTAMDPAVLSGITEGKLNLIQSLLEKKDFAGAQKGLEQVKASIVDPKQQADWLWFTAEANAGVAGDTKDATALKNLAVDYVRVVANFPTSPRSSQALMKTAAIMEKLDDTKAAVAVYSQVSHDYGDQPAGRDAKQAMERLKSK